jgi:hypothetical protein
VGYANAYTLKYTENGSHRNVPVLRGLATDAWQRAFIFGKAWDYIDGKPDASHNFLLLAGRVCVDSNIFEADVLFEYIEYMCSRTEMRAELSRGLHYVLSSQNALTKACLYAPASSRVSDRLKRFFSTCFTYWPEVKKNANVRTLFAYIRSLERIVGKNKLGGLQDYLVEQILHNPHIRPDLSEEYRSQFMA